MSETLETLIKRQIVQSGPMSVGEYMGLCLSHPKHGYYMKKDPFGRCGDFVTAPEVSQLFGEMMGVWAADVWLQMGAPKAFVLLECGPGRGTLMADILRATKGVEGFLSAAQVHLLEISPVLKDLQRERLHEHDVCWHESLESVPQDVPIIVIANEFLDALPFRSLLKAADGQWAERVVVVEEDDLGFGLRPAGKELTDLIPFDVKGAAAGSVYELSLARQSFVEAVVTRLLQKRGAALFIDYGHIKSASGDTFQAVKNNEFADLLKNAGDADLTSHVDFEALVQGLPNEVAVHGPIRQGEFLRGLGIEVRAQGLKKIANEKQGADLEKGLHRLCASDQMGALFKVLVLSA